MGRKTRWYGAVAAAALSMTTPVSAQGPGYPELGRDEELKLALSAGPPAIGANASAYLMTEHGFERAIEGTNGYACIVVRSAAGKHQLAPHCLDPAAVATVLPAFLREGELQAQGMSADAINAEMKRMWGTGELPLPAGPAHAYMLSEGQVLGPRGTNFRPHFMLYVPYLTNADVGGSLERPEFPFVGPFEDHPLSTLVIVMDEFVSPSEIRLPMDR